MGSKVKKEILKFIYALGITGWFLALIFALLVPIATLYITIKTASLDFLVKIVIFYSVAGFLFHIASILEVLLKMISEYKLKYKR